MHIWKGVLHKYEVDPELTNSYQIVVDEKNQKFKMEYMIGTQGEDE